MEYYGPQLNALLKKMDWSQKILALNIRKSPQYVNCLLNNKKKASQAVMEQIARTVGMSLEELKKLGCPPAPKPDDSPKELVQQGAAESLWEAFDMACKEVEHWKSRAMAAEMALGYMDSQSEQPN